MKVSLSILFLIVALQGYSQLPGRTGPAILIRNNHNYKFVRIAAGTGFSARAGGKTISGYVKKVKADTLFLKDTFVRFRDIDTLYLENAMRMSGPFASHIRKPDYVAGSAAWQVFIPPDSVYRNAICYHNYIAGLERKARREKFGHSSALTYKNFLKFNLTKLAHLEIAFSYDRYIAKRFYWETELSVMFGVQSADAYYTMPYPAYNYNGVTFTTNPKFYLGKSNAYLGPVAMYRYLWFTGVRTDWPDEQDNGMLQDQYRNDVGLSLRIGYMRRKGQFVADFYLGGGIKYVFLHQLIYADYLYHDSGQMHWRHPDHSPDVYDRTLWQPVINFGIKIGFGF